MLEARPQTGIVETLCYEYILSISAVKKGLMIDRLTRLATTQLWAGKDGNHDSVHKICTTEDSGYPLVQYQSLQTIYRSSEQSQKAGFD